MKRWATSAGFTIVETMVVLAVTGALFVAIAATISGRQQSSEFTQAIQDVRSQLQQYIANVQSGYYTSAGDFSCTAGDAASALVFSNAAPKQLGTNAGCIFLGNAIQVQANDLIVYPVAARRLATSMSDAQATPVVSADGTTVNESSTYQYKNGLTAVKTVYNDGSNTPINALAMLATPGTDISQTNTNAANQAIDIFALDGVNANDDAAVAAQSIHTALNTVGKSVKNPSGGVSICFESGSTNQYGLVTIGLANRQLAVGLQIMDKSGNPNCNLG